MTERCQLLHRFTFGLALTAALALATLYAGTAAAQSGRRLPKSAPTPVPSPQPLPVENKPAEKPKPALRFIVGIEQRGVYAATPSYLFDSVLRACAGRLDDAPLVEVDVSQRDMSRGEAIKRAKAEKEAYVVWLHLRSDRISSGPETDLNELYLEYAVFAPTTARLAASGQTYPRAYGSRGVIVAPRVPGRTNLPYIEQALKQAAREAAERILAALTADVRPGRVPG
jgi:hypothetical protein